MDQLITACRTNNYENALLCIVNLKYNLKYNFDKPFIKACEHGSLKIVKLFIEDEDIEDEKIIKEGMIEAITNNHIDIVKYLVNKSKITITEKMLLEANSNFKMISFLLKNGGDINLCDEDILVNPCENNNIEIVKLILEYGFKNRNGLSLAIASQENNLDIVNLLIDNEFDIFYDDGLILNNIIWSCNDNIRLVEKLLKMGIKANIDDNKFIRRACEKQHINVIKLLLKYGAKINKQDLEKLEKKKIGYEIELKKLTQILNLVKN